MNVNGVELIDQGDMVVKDARKTGSFEIDTFFMWHKFALDNPHTAAVDVGAYTGLYAIGAAMLALHHNVHAIEPNPVVYNRMQENIRANGVHITQHHLAVSHYGSPYEVMLGLKNSTFLTSAGSISIDPKIHTHTIPVRCKPLDQVIDGPVGVIKIDVENHELAVLRGAKNILDAYHPSLIIEALTDAQARSIIDHLMIEHGYQAPVVCDVRNLVFEK